MPSFLGPEVIRDPEFLCPKCGKVEVAIRGDRCGICKNVWGEETIWMKIKKAFQGGNK